jgi:hypothetical protein
LFSYCSSKSGVFLVFSSSFKGLLGILEVSEFLAVIFLSSFFSVEILADPASVSRAFCGAKTFSVV